MREKTYELSYCSVITYNGATTIASQNRKVRHQFNIPATSLEPHIQYCHENSIHFDIHTAFDLYLYMDKLHELILKLTDLYRQFLIEPKQFPGWVREFTAKLITL